MAEEKSLEQSQKERAAAEALIRQISTSTSPFYTVETVRRELEEAGFEKLLMTEPWDLKKGGKYYVSGYDRTLFAFTVGQEKAPHQNIRVAEAHTDFPCLKVKPDPEISSLGCRKLNIETYGSPIYNTWLDRPLSLSGKVALRSDDPFRPRTALVDFGRPVATIPNLAIHMNRAVNDGVKLDPQKDMIPLADLSGNEIDERFFRKALAAEIGCEPEDILEYELYVYMWEQGAFVGFDESLLSSPRLDNITSVRAAVQGLLRGTRTRGLNVIGLFDNEEVGSATKQGAGSDLLVFLLERVYLALGGTREELMADIVDGFLLSLDVAHAVHPNYPERADIINRPVLGGGVTFKMAASQSYAGDCETVATVQALCEQAGVPFQRFVNRAGLKGGRTLGSIASTSLPMKTTDVGIAILAMHSSRELMGMRDQWALERLVEELFS